MEMNDPMEKHMMKKSPDESSRIRHKIATMAQSCHMFSAKYCIIVLRVWLFL